MAEENVPLRGFAQLIAALDDGRLHSELSDETKRVASELYRWAGNNGGKAKGRLTLTLDMTADSNDTITIVGKVATKTPPEPSGRTITWLGPDNQLHLSNPKQLKLGMREVAPLPKREEATAAAGKDKA
jgi:hypothetical protein